MVAPAWNLTVMRPLPLTIVAAHTTMPNAANLLTPQPGEKGGPATNGTRYVTVDLGAATDFRQVFLGYGDHDGLTDSIRIRAGNTLATPLATGLVLDTGQISPDAQTLARPSGYRHYFYHHAAGNVNARYVQVEVTNNGVDAYNPGILALGLAIQPEFNADYSNTSWGYEEADEPELLDSGVEVLYDSTPAPVFQFSLSWLSEAEMNADWEPLGRLQHEGTPVLVARRPDIHSTRHNGLFWGRLRMRPIVAADFDMYEVQGTIRSMV